MVLIFRFHEGAAFSYFDMFQWDIEANVFFFIELTKKIKKYFVF